MTSVPRRQNIPMRIIAFIATVVGGTTAGVIAGVLSVAMYPVVFRKRGAFLRCTS